MIYHSYNTIHLRGMKIKKKIQLNNSKGRKSKKIIRKRLRKILRKRIRKRIKKRIGWITTQNTS